MATVANGKDTSGDLISPAPQRGDPTAWHRFTHIMKPLASMRLTVVLFALAIIIVLAGTLAQARADVWQVVHDYFRIDFAHGDWSSWRGIRALFFAWIPWQTFFPPAFFPDMKPIPDQYGIWFPKGWLIGMVMFINLLAAHLTLFRIQAKSTRLVAGVFASVLGVFLAWVLIASGVYETAERAQVFVDWPSLRILWLLALCTGVSVVLLVGAILLFRKRAGIVVLHLGIGTLMIGELLVGVGADEGQMQIVEGQTVSHTIDLRELELAMVDHSDPHADQVTAIPQSRFLVGQRLADAELPVDVEVLQFMPNSKRQAVSDSATNLATAGAGLAEMAVPAPVISSTDRTGRANAPALYVRLVDKQSKQPIGTYLLTLQRALSNIPEPVSVNGKNLDLYLRYKRTYKPYSMHLIDVRLDRYMGTNTPRSYSSTLQLVDTTNQHRRRVRIWMNNPLRFAGETFYQSNYGRDPTTGVEYTGLQIVTNRSWRIPYLACAMTSVGMLAQFWLVLLRFLHRRKTAVGVGDEASESPLCAAAPPAKPLPNSTTASDHTAIKIGNLSLPAWSIPVIAVALAAVWFATKAYMPAPHTGQMNVRDFGRLPVMYEGRIKPIDTLARNSLRIISDKQSFKDQQGRTQPAARWLLDVIVDADAALNHRVFRIQSLEVLDTLDLPRRPGFRYAINEFRDNLNAFDRQVQQARATAPEQRDLYARKILELENRLQLYMLLREAFRVPQLRADHLNEDAAMEASRHQQLAQYTLPLALPPASGEGDWETYTHGVFTAMLDRIQGQTPNPAAVQLVTLLNAYQKHNVEEFNKTVADYRAYLDRHKPAHWQARKTDFEAFYNHLAPFYHAMVLYMFAFILGCLSWFGWTRPLNRAAFWLIVFTFVVHSAALVGRMIISGRPPVTNLYSSAVFIGWGCVILGMVLERFFPDGVGNIIASVSGFVTLLVAFLLTTAVTSFKGDTFTVLQAVLDTQFWLATHVTCITLGYSTTFVAGLLGIIYVVRGVLTRSLDDRVADDITRMLYGTVCFAILFSFVGTVLGGLWADDSWGRFWGWDPKENGALIIVLWNALVLHARWSRLVRQRGLAVLAIFGNVVTAWSWFGVNELGIGLHSYGFTEGVLLVLGAFAASQIALIMIGMLPKSLWRSPLTKP